MYPYIQIIIPSYGLMAFIGGFIALMFVYFRISKFGIEFTYLLKILLLSIIGCVVGSKLLFAITQIPTLIADFSLYNLIFLIPRSGFVFFGGLFGVIFMLYIATRKNPELMKNVFNLVAPAIPLFHSFGRIGCFLAGCCYGKSLETPINFLGIIEFDRIPTQLIEALFEFFLFFVLLFIEKKFSNIDLLTFYLCVYAVFRFFNEFFRGDDLRGIACGFSTSQCISVIILIVFLVKLIIKKGKPKMKKLDNN